MKGIKIKPIYEEPFLCPSKFAMAGEIISIIIAISVGIAQKNSAISIALPVILLLSLGVTYLVYRVDKDVRRNRECFAIIGQAAEYEDIKQFHAQYQVLNDLGDGRYLVVKRHHATIVGKEAHSWTE